MIPFSIYVCFIYCTLYIEIVCLTSLCGKNRHGLKVSRTVMAYGFGLQL